MRGDGSLLIIDEGATSEEEDEGMTVDSVDSGELLDYESRPGFATEWLEQNKDKI